jgi:hypothetical protein
MEIGEGFVLIGEQERQSPTQLAKAEPGRGVVVEQVLFAEVEPWQKGDAVGELHALCTRTHGDQALCHVVLRFGDGDTMTAAGVLPIGDPSFGAGSLTVTGGTGGLRRVQGELMVEVTNPKRWIMIP